MDSSAPRPDFAASFSPASKIAGGGGQRRAQTEKVVKEPALPSTLGWTSVSAGRSAGGILFPAATWGRGFRPAAGLPPGVFESRKPAEWHETDASRTQGHAWRKPGGRAEALPHQFKTGVQLGQADPSPFAAHNVQGDGGQEAQL
jgi:hypothetical protein